MENNRQSCDFGCFGGIGRHWLENWLKGQTSRSWLAEMKLNLPSCKILSEVRPLSCRVLDLLDAAAVDDFAQQLEADLVINCRSGYFSPALSLRSRWKCPGIIKHRFDWSLVAAQSQDKALSNFPLWQHFCSHPYLEYYSASKAASLRRAYCLAYKSYASKALRWQFVFIYCTGLTAIFPSRVTECFR